jgi:hypothetical protein
VVSNYGWDAGSRGEHIPGGNEMLVQVWWMHRCLLLQLAADWHVTSQQQMFERLW